MTTRSRRRASTGGAAAAPALALRAGDRVRARGRHEAWEAGVVLETRDAAAPTAGGQPSNRDAMRRPPSRKRANGGAHAAAAHEEGDAAAAGDAVGLGGWVLVDTGAGHAPEWLLFAPGGPVCVADRGGPCVCERHQEDRAQGDEDAGEAARAAAAASSSSSSSSSSSRKRQRATPRRAPAATRASATTAAQQTRDRKRRRVTPRAGAYKEVNENSDEEDDNEHFRESSAEEYDDEDAEEDEDEEDDGDAAAGGESRGRRTRGNFAKADDDDDEDDDEEDDDEEDDDEEDDDEEDDDEEGDDEEEMKRGEGAPLLTRNGMEGGTAAHTAANGSTQQEHYRVDGNDAQARVEEGETSSVNGRRTRLPRRARADSKSTAAGTPNVKAESDKSVANDTSLMIDGHYSFNHDKLNLVPLREFDPVRHGNITPSNIEDLRYRLHLPMADVFREAFLEGGQINAAYCWMKNLHLHRPSIQDAGHRLQQWYVTHVDRSPPEGPPPNFGERMRDRRNKALGIEETPEAKNKRYDRERERRLKRVRDRDRDRMRDRKAERERRRERSANVRMNDLVPDLPLGVTLVGSKWEAKVHLAPNLSRTFPVGTYALSDDACKGLELARKAIAEHRAQMAVERKITIQEMVRSGVTSQCAVCQKPINEPTEPSPSVASAAAEPRTQNASTPAASYSSAPAASTSTPSAPTVAPANESAMEIVTSTAAPTFAVPAAGANGAVQTPAVPSAFNVTLPPTAATSTTAAMTAASVMPAPVLGPASSATRTTAAAEGASAAGLATAMEVDSTRAAASDPQTVAPAAAIATSVTKTWQGCDLCTRKYHFPSCLSAQFESDEMTPRDPACETCSACLKLLLQLATEAARSVVPSAGGGRRASRRRADFDAADDSRHGGATASPASRGAEVDRPSFGFPVSKSFIRTPTAPRPKNKVLRRRDGVDLASRSQWLCEGYLDGGTRSRSRVYFTEFRYLDEPEVHYRLLDHVLLFRISPDGEEEDEDDEDDEDEDEADDDSNVKLASVPTAIGAARTPRSGGLQPASPMRKPTGAAADAQAGGAAGPAPAGHTGPVDALSGSANGAGNGHAASTSPPKASSPKGKRKSGKVTPDFYVGQIEAMWEETDGQRKARIAWFFWPEETQIPPDQVLQDEVFSSNEVDTVPLSSIAAKVLVLPHPAYVEHHRAGLSAYDPGRSGAVLTGRTVDAQTFAGWVPLGGAEGDEDGGVAETRSSSRRGGAKTPGAGTPARSGGKNASSSSVAYKSSPGGGSMAADNGQELEIGTRLREKYRDKLLLARRVLFCRRHYHYRANKIVGGYHPSMKTGSALNPWMHTFLLASFEEPDSARLLDEADRNSDEICNYTLGIADSKSDPAVDTLCEVSSIKEMLDAAPQCAYCFENLPFVGHIKCAVCTGVTLCFECFNLGRQGLVSAENGVRVLHRCSHPYRVARPVLDYSNPALAEQILNWMCTMYGLAQPTYEIIGIVRGPLPASEERAPSTRYRHAITVDYGVARIKIKHSKSGQISRVIGSRYGKSAAESRGIAAVDALAAVFGVANKYTGPLLANDWSGSEAMRLVDSLEAHSLAWEPAEEVVGSKLALECAQYFTCYLHPAWASQSEWAESLRKLHEENEIPQGKDTYKGRLPPAAPESVATATRDATIWGNKVHQMAVRRSKVARRTARGLAFAVIDGQTVFAKRPDAFTSRVTQDTDPILRHQGIYPSKLVPAQAFVEARDTPYSSFIRGTGRSACGVCGHPVDSNGTQLVICDGCDSEFHPTCLQPPLEAAPEGDWFCPDCVEDREYIYDHASWGDAGEALVRAVTLVSSEDERTQTWKERALEWRDNNTVLKRATAAALAMGFTVTAAASTPKASKSGSKTAPSRSKAPVTPAAKSAKKTAASSKKPARPSGKTRCEPASGTGKSTKTKSVLRRASSSSSHPAIASAAGGSAGPGPTSRADRVSVSPPPPPFSSATKPAAEAEDTTAGRPSEEVFQLPPPPIIAPGATPGEALAAYVAHERKFSGEDVDNEVGGAIPESDLRLFSRELLAESSWETRHYAASRIANLEASNHGLAEALSLVVAQRDALLGLLSDKTEPQPAVGEPAGAQSDTPAQQGNPSPAGQEAALDRTAS